MRDQILNEIKRLANVNNGQPPGQGVFSRETGISRSSWRGVYWARWGDALAEAGFDANIAPQKFTQDFLFQKLSEACRHFGRRPSVMELRLYKRSHKEFPDHSTFMSHFRSTANAFLQLNRWATEKSDYNDIAAMLSDAGFVADDKSPPAKEGLVYLIKSGPHYKIGRSDELERRVKEIRIALPEAASLVHSIRTDDPAGIEAYWHRRFDDRRANGEWFKLSNADLAAFKRRKFQ